MIYPNKSFTTDIPYTYIHVTHLLFCGRIFKHTIFKIVYGKKELLPKSLSYTFYTVYYCEHTSFLPKKLVTTQYSSSKECDTFDRTTIGRSAGRCDFSGSLRLHTIDLKFLYQNVLHRLTITDLSRK